MGSRSIYQLEDAEARIQSNVDAMFDVFEKYHDLLSPHLPSHTLDYLVSQKYLNHANGALVNGKIQLALSLIKKSLSRSKGKWFKFFYLKFFLKLPLKIIFGFPHE